MRKAKAKVQEGDERVRATMETILRDYVPQPSERPTPAGGEQYPRMATSHAQSLGDVMRARSAS
ncbi:MAG TPA: hypothetical protein VG275_00720 [Solirubrobacteraceae bacterium]|jgi:hypothetical protein|nr:hypothetical protein [Solirubrobacteraceae bacterium]